MLQMPGAACTGAGAGDRQGQFCSSNPQRLRYPCLCCQQSDIYRPLLNHEAADVLRTMQMQPDLTVLIVGETWPVVVAGWMGGLVRGLLAEDAGGAGGFPTITHLGLA